MITSHMALHSSFTTSAFDLLLFPYRYSNVDMQSQEAYELAVKGLLGPEGKSEPILTGLRCIHFQPPNFTLGK